jgi:hypothetical protein
MSQILIPETESILKILSYSEYSNTTGKNNRSWLKHKFESIFYGCPAPKRRPGSACCYLCVNNIIFRQIHININIIKVILDFF